MKWLKRALFYAPTFIKKTATRVLAGAALAAGALALLQRAGLQVMINPWLIGSLAVAGMIWPDLLDYTRVI